MGRHRRLANPLPAAPGPRSVDAPTATMPAAGPDGPARRRSHRATSTRGAAPVRTGLLGASAAVAMGAVAVASGLIPGGSHFDGGTGDGPGERVRAGALPEATAPQGALSVSPSERATLPASRGSARAAVPGATGPTTPTTSPSPHRPAKSPTRKADSPGSAAPTGHPSAAASAAATPRPTASVSDGTGSESSAEAQVLALVNQERSRAGCSPVTADPELASLAQRFSDDMARRGFFDHTDPDGHTPWDRAEAQGISDLGGENIARGQATAQAVMDTWMHSPGHRANILNCEYKTLGVGAHFGPGGPWWTQDFGF
ncbi:CAP domain-containing protein [Streptomyces sp. NPDC048197]|uniref:CAP domain-containing protein n=1 Tax=Streptomyces sp. NPDC048197 TaxID=3365511 RepID=UPI00370FC8F6